VCSSHLPMLAVDCCCCALSVSVQSNGWLAACQRACTCTPSCKGLKGPLARGAVIKQVAVVQCADASDRSCFCCRLSNACCKQHCSVAGVGVSSSAVSLRVDVQCRGCSRVWWASSLGMPPACMAVCSYLGPALSVSDCRRAPLR
jgi:hypothetical protein